MANTPLSALAVLLSVVALYLPTRTQTFTRVTVDGRSLRLLVEGGGDATVVFENGAGPPLEQWGKVQPAVARFARTVSYDRAGVGLSDEGPRPRDGRQIAHELHRALGAANIAAPYVIVGASLGGPYVRVFANRYPAEVQAIVLVDPTPDTERLDAAAGQPELEALADTLDQARASRVPAGVPVFLIDAVSPVDIPFASRAIRTARQNNRAGLIAESQEYERWLASIPNSHVIVTNSGHNVAQERPDVIVATIREAIERSEK
jgi:pimeloyl-ACP methyl ester carboxylesterase